MTLLWVGLAFAEPSSREIFQPDPNDKDPWADIELQIEQIKCDDRQQCAVLARGQHNGVPVGLEVVIGAIHGKQRGVLYRSIGSDSDRLLATLKELYKVDMKERVFKPGAYADAVILSGDIAHIESKRIDIKVFFSADGPEAQYAELYTNVDPVNRVLEIHEKDPDYRRNILGALGK